MLVDASTLPLVGVQSGLDMLVFQVEQNCSTWTHVQSFPALAYIMQGKKNKKFMRFTTTKCVMVDDSYVYAYDGVAPRTENDEEVEQCRNRKHQLLPLSDDTSKSQTYVCSQTSILCFIILIIVDLLGMDFCGESALALLAEDAIMIVNWTRQQ